MAGSTEIETLNESDSSPGMRIGRVRWTICAMLFVATSINYMDRQVIAILKPTLQHSIGMTELDYGHIVGAFTLAYAIGLLFAGWFVDKVGTRIGYMVIMAVWSLSAMGHALANSVLEFGIARTCLGLGESGNFPAAIKTTAEWFPQSERSLATGIFNSGTNLGAILAPLIVPWVTIRYGWHAAFLVTGIFSALWIVLWFSKYRKPADHPTLTGAELRFIYQEAAEQMGPSTPWAKLLSYRQTWAFAIGKFLTDPDLVVLSLLAALVLQREVSSQPLASGPAAHHRLQRFGRRQHRRRLAARAIPSLGALGCECAVDCHAPLRMLCGSHLSDQLPSIGVGRHRTAQPRCSCSSGLVCKSLHHPVGYVSAHRSRLGNRHWRHGRLGRRLPACHLCGLHSATYP